MGQKGKKTFQGITTKLLPVNDLVISCYCDGCNCMAFHYITLIYITQFRNDTLCDRTNKWDFYASLNTNNHSVHAENAKYTCIFLYASIFKAFILDYSEFSTENGF